MDYDPDEFFEEEIDGDVEKAKPYLEDLILQQKAVTERELKVRLEKQFFPWVISRALDSMMRAHMISKADLMLVIWFFLEESWMTRNTMSFWKRT
jgi:hypothetical protein